MINYFLLKNLFVLFSGESPPNQATSVTDLRVGPPRSSHILTPRTRKNMPNTVGRFLSLFFFTLIKKCYLC